MTSRERVLAALDHRPADKVPIDFGGHRSSGIAALAYPKLRKALGLPPRPVRVYDPVQQLAILDDDVLERFQVDTIELGRGFALEEKDWADWTLPDGTPCQMPAWALPERQENAVGHPLGQRPAAGPDAPGGHLLRAVLLALPRTRRSRPSGRSPEREHVVCGAESARPAGGRDRTASAGWPKGHASSASGPTGRSSGCSAATCWRPASSSTATTTSSCSWPATRGGRTSSSTGWWKSTWRTWSGSSPPSDPRSTSSCSATTWGCRTGRRFRRPCTGSSSSRGTRRCGGGRRNWPTSR